MSGSYPTFRAASGRVRRFDRPLLLRVAVVAVAGLVVVLLVMIGLGYLILPANPPTTVTISEVRWTILQGTNPNGRGWFGNSPINETPPAESLPWTTDSGSLVKVAILLLGGNHTIYNVTSLTSGFTVVSTTPAMPCAANGVDDFALAALVRVPSVSSDVSYVLEMEINAEGPSGAP